MSTYASILARSPTFLKDMFYQREFFKYSIFFVTLFHSELVGFLNLNVKFIMSNLSCLETGSFSKSMKSDYTNYINLH